ncbi:unnamed protein product [Aspergillus oryzae]|nr:unnamed protein product [Aspergillus oryzae]GMF91285.1 unnamed protein product [Aspergillus oryzae]
MGSVYSPVRETGRIFSYLCDQAERLNLPSEVVENKNAVSFDSSHDEVYYPIPFKETETLAALKGVEGSVAAAIANLRYGPQKRGVKVNLERATAFGCQAYMAKVDGLSKLDPEVKKKLKGGKLYLRVEVLADQPRHRFACGAVEWLPPDVCKPIQN